MRQRLAWWGVFLGCLVPLSVVVSAIVADRLGPDPAKEVVLQLGTWAIRFLVLALCITPLSRVRGWKGMLRFRRMIGLYAWFYASLHVLAFLLFLMNWNDWWAELTKRPYIVAGFLAYLILFLMGVTSNRFMMRHLGKRWKPLHRLVYLAAILVSLHFIWLSRSDLADAVLYSVVFALLLGYRLTGFVRKQLRSSHRIRTG